MYCNFLMLPVGFDLTCIGYVDSRLSELIKVGMNIDGLSIWICFQLDGNSIPCMYILPLNEKLLKYCL